MARAFFFLSLLAALSPARAERLPLKTYTTADGLAHNQLNKIVRDSQGFLWFCTGEGLARFDGYTFTNYTTDHGLPHRNVTDLLETRAGEFWVGTNAGLVRFNPKGAPGHRVISANEADAAAPPMFTVVVPEDEDRRAKVVNVLLEGRDGALWCGTWKGLYRLEQGGRRYVLRPVDTGMPDENLEQQIVRDLLEDRHGSLWVAAASGLYRRWPDDTAARYTKRDGLPDDYINDLLEDRQGGLWAGTRYGGFFRFAANATHAPPVVAGAHKDWGGRHNWVYQLFETSDRRFWVASNVGLVEFFPDGDGQGRQFRVYTARNGLLYHEITTLNEDAGGNLWLGSYAGAMKLASSGFVTYDERDGLLGVGAIFGDAAGGVCFRGYVLGDERRSVFDGAKLDLLRPADQYHFRYGRFDGQRFTWFMPGVPRSGNFGWVGEGVTLQARDGEWWLGTGEGLYRFPAADDFTRIKHARPLAVYQTKEGLINFQQVFRIFEDSRGDIWASTIAGPHGLARWERASEIFHRDLADSPGLPSPKDDLARAFGEDATGNIWIGFGTGLARYREGRFTFFDTKDGLPPGGFQNIHRDRRGRLWLASARGGLIRVDDPTAERPVFISYTTAEGLSSNSAEVITEDLAGRIYVGTGRGLDRLDPETNRIKRFTTADGLTPGQIAAAFRAPDGALWFGTNKGLSRFTPGANDLAAAPPPILITKLQVAGERALISATGASEVRLPDLAAERNQLQIDYVALSFAPGEVLRYQYKLEGADSDWLAPTEQRAVNYARLAPGAYRFLVRAVNSDGVVSPTPATITFTILRPFWQRSWFLASAALAVGLLIYAAYRYRIARLLEVAQIRTRIASDLHDDIGAGLSRIAVLSEVARHEAGGSPVTERLSIIARASRELVDSMSDIVWVINPERDELRDLTQRMRRFASDVLTARDIQFTFRAPDLERHLKVGADVRRQIFLIFKECVNNIVRHSGCARVDIELRIEGGWSTLTVKDDGRGFDPAGAGDGNGLVNMRERARSMGGQLQVDSSDGRGTTVILRVPLRATVKERNGRLRGARP
ncbi:MAG: ATP-binding protein [Acidobacteriota bacterium]|nr:ATP-binding protein [Acidobacteriota bacterium]